MSVHPDLASNQATFKKGPGSEANPDRNFQRTKIGPLDVQPEQIFHTIMEHGHTRLVLCKLARVLYIRFFKTGAVGRRSERVFKAYRGPPRLRQRTADKCGCEKHH